VDPHRLLRALRTAGIGEPRKPALPSAADSTPANGRDAALMVLEQRRQSLRQGGPGLRPSFYRRDDRLPLLVKYNKPPGVLGQLRGQKKDIRQGIEDLRSVVALAGDKFELDLYHPVGELALGSAGILLWSRNSQITRSLLDKSRQVVSVFEAEVSGVVSEDELKETLRRGVDIGVTGFAAVKYLDLRSAKFIESSSLQDPHSRIEIATLSSSTSVESALEACGHPTVWIRRTQVGMLCLKGLAEGGLAAATAEEETWACELAGLSEDDYPPGILTSRAETAAAQDLESAGVQGLEGNLVA